MAFYDMTWRAMNVRPWVKVSKTRLKEATLQWVRGVGLRPKDIAWEDAARAVCAGAGMLARDHNGNEVGRHHTPVCCVLLHPREFSRAF
jgi:hypothetical protein